MAVQVFFCSIEPLREARLFAKYYGCASSDRRDRMECLRNEDDRLRSLAAGLMLEQALNACGVPPNLRRVERMQNGKPVLAESSLQFSLSHSGSVALCAISASPVGADVQTLRMPSPALVKRVCSAEEQRWLSSQPDFAVAFTSLWARKESLLKATDRTIAADLRQLCVLSEQVFCFSETSLFGLPACVCCKVGGQVSWNGVDLADDEIQNSFDSSSQF